MARSKDLTDSQKDIAAVVAESLATPPPSLSAISQTEMESIARKECDKCHAPGGHIWELWEEFKPIRQRVWLATGMIALIVALMGWFIPRINSKLDALDGMAKDLAVLQTQVAFLIATRHDPSPPAYAAAPKQTP